jgi:O-antigen/teichoic acid export membrane protein
MEDGDPKGALSQVSLNGVFLLTILAPTCAGAALLSAPMVNLLISERFREVTIFILPVALMVAAIRSLRLHSADQTMILVEDTRATMYVSMFEAVANTILCAIGLHFGGIVGAALGALCGTSAAAVMAFAYSFIRLRLPPPSLWTLGRILGATALMTISLRFMPMPDTVSSLALAVGAGSVIYAGLILAAFPEARAGISHLAARRVTGKT